MFFKKIPSLWYRFCIKKCIILKNAQKRNAKHHCFYGAWHNLTYILISKSIGMRSDR